MRMPRLAALAGVTLLAGALTACSIGPLQACPAVGWSNQVRVAVTGDADGVESVTFCGGASCPVPAPPPPSPGAFGTTARDGEIWTIPIDMTTPRTGHLGAFDGAGALLLDQRVMLSWKRIGGTAECGGPERADVSLWMP